MNINEITPGLKKRFCKDCNLPITVFHEPVFSERIELLDKMYSSVEKWEIFVNELFRYNSEQEYFEYYNSVKEAMMHDIKVSEGFIKFNTLNVDYSKEVDNSYPKGSIFKESNEGRKFLHVDMRKANFSAMQYFDSKIFKYAKTWEEFVRKYTNNQHIINSKYIRQVVMGNCNPKRQIQYEKFLMSRVLDLVLEVGRFPKDRVVSFINDEFILDVTEDCIDVSYANTIQKIVKGYFAFPLTVELYTLHKIKGTEAYLKEIYSADNNVKYELKCVNSFEMPFILRYLNGEEVKENDKIFYHEGRLAKYIEDLEIEVCCVGK